MERASEVESRGSRSAFPAIPKVLDGKADEQSVRKGTSARNEEAASVGLRGKPRNSETLRVKVSCKETSRIGQVSNQNKQPSHFYRSQDFGICGTSLSIQTP